MTATAIEMDVIGRLRLSSCPIAIWNGNPACPRPSRDGLLIGSIGHLTPSPGPRGTTTRSSSPMVVGRERPLPLNAAQSRRLGSTVLPRRSRAKLLRLKDRRTLERACVTAQKQKRLARTDKRGPSHWPRICAKVELYPEGGSAPPLQLRNLTPAIRRQLAGPTPVDRRRHQGWRTNAPFAAALQMRM
jgi:hypothetical protein